MYGKEKESSEYHIEVVVLRNSTPELVTTAAL